MGSKEKHINYAGVRERRAPSGKVKKREMARKRRKSPE